MRKIKVHIYIITFIITASIFISAFLINNLLNEKRISQIKNLQDNISLDILSLETQFDLLAEQSCENIKQNSILSKELVSLGNKLVFMEQELGTKNEKVIHLKKFYSLLEIKDYLLMKKVTKKCTNSPIFILYFYSNNNCRDCIKQGYALTRLAKEYPKLRIYSFDYNLNLPAIKTLTGIYKIKNRLPAIFVNKQVFYGYKTIDELKTIIPQLSDLETEFINSTTTISD